MEFKGITLEIIELDNWARCSEIKLLVKRRELTGSVGLLNGLPGVFVSHINRRIAAVR